jgi:hypothetical protein
MPNERLPPKRRASALSTTKPKLNTKIAKVTSSFFMVFPVLNNNGVGRFLMDVIGVASDLLDI